MFKPANPSIFHVFTHSLRCLRRQVVENLFSSSCPAEANPREQYWQHMTSATESNRFEYHWEPRAVVAQIQVCQIWPAGQVEVALASAAIKRVPCH